MAMITYGRTYNQHDSKKRKRSHQWRLNANKETENERERERRWTQCTETKRRTEYDRWVGVIVHLNAFCAGWRLTALVLCSRHRSREVSLVKLSNSLTTVRQLAIWRLGQVLLTRYCPCYSSICLFFYQSINRSIPVWSRGKSFVVWISFVWSLHVSCALDFLTDELRTSHHRWS